MTVRTVDGINVNVIRKNVKNINLRITCDGRVTLSVPKRTSDESIDSYILSKKEWIKKTLSKFEDSPNGAQVFMEENTVNVLGEHFTVHLIEGKRYSCIIEGKSMVIAVPHGSSYQDTESYMREWYRSVLKSVIPELLSKWEGITGMSCSEWTTRYMRTKWGVCHCSTNKICFNVRLAEKPIECIEYVVLHELAHTKVSNHGPDFKAILNRYMPDWKERKNLLNYGVRSR